MATQAVHRLVIMRHAKAEQAAANDHARRLTDRGRSDAKSAGEWLAGSGHRPELILASSAARAEETAEIVATVAGVRRIEMLDGLYRADAYDAMDIVSAVGDDVGTVMVVGHNPTMAELASLLQADDADVLRFPTSGIAVLECDDELWTDLDGGQATLMTSYSSRA
ncbi:MAG: phosphohistidine phosphatase SixA [Propionibacteriales bacterium]|nr:phosphohistidine phosphatase SixA [Propionibacteriales bacterium]